MMDQSRSSLNLKRVLIKERVELVVGEEANKINRFIHLKYVTPDALDDPTGASYLSSYAIALLYNIQRKRYCP